VRAIAQVTTCGRVEGGLSGLPCVCDWIPVAADSKEQIAGLSKSGAWRPMFASIPTTASCWRILTGCGCHQHTDHWHDNSGVRFWRARTCTCRKPFTMTVAEESCCVTCRQDRAHRAVEPATSTPSFASRGARPLRRIGQVRRVEIGLLLIPLKR